MLFRCISQRKLICRYSVNANRVNGKTPPQMSRSRITLEVQQRHACLGSKYLSFSEYVWLFKAAWLDTCTDRHKSRLYWWQLWVKPSCQTCGLSLSLTLILLFKATKSTVTGPFMCTNTSPYCRLYTQACTTLSQNADIYMHVQVFGDSCLAHLHTQFPFSSLRPFHFEASFLSRHSTHLAKQTNFISLSQNSSPESAQ